MLPPSVQGRCRAAHSQSFRSQGRKRQWAAQRIGRCVGRLAEPKAPAPGQRLAAYLDLVAPARDASILLWSSASRDAISD